MSNGTSGSVVALLGQRLDHCWKKVGQYREYSLALILEYRVNLSCKNFFCSGVVHSFPGIFCNWRAHHPGQYPPWNRTGHTGFGYNYGYGTKDREVTRWGEKSGQMFTVLIYT